MVLFWILFRIRIYAIHHFGYLHNAALLTTVVVALLAVHLMEVLSWAAFYFYKGCFSDFNTSLYFSIGAYTTLGDGEALLGNPEWRLLGGVEALLGSLMLCWSTVILVRVVTEVYRYHVEHWEEPQSHQVIPHAPSKTIQ